MVLPTRLSIKKNGRWLLIAFEKTKLTSYKQIGRAKIAKRSFVFDQDQWQRNINLTVKESYKNELNELNKLKKECDFSTKASLHSSAISKMELVSAYYSKKTGQLKYNLRAPLAKCDFRIFNRTNPEIELYECHVTRFTQHVTGLRGFTKPASYIKIFKRANLLARIYKSIHGIYYLWTNIHDFGMAIYEKDKQGKFAQATAGYLAPEAFIRL